MSKQIKRAPTRGHIRLLYKVSNAIADIEHRIYMNKMFKPKSDVFTFNQIPGLIARKRKLKQWYRELSK